MSVWLVALLFAAHAEVTPAVDDTDVAREVNDEDAPTADEEESDERDDDGDGDGDGDRDAADDDQQKPGADNAEPASKPNIPALQGPARPIAELRKEALAKKRYAFCHEERTLVPLDSLAYCKDIPPEAATLCPAWAKLCDRLKARMAERDESSEVAMPAWLRWAFLTLLLVAIALVVAKVVKGSIGAKADDASEDGNASAVEALAIEDPNARVETDVARLLMLADKAAARGDFLEAIDHAYAALLRRLEWNQIVTVTKDSTNGDYLREISKNAPDLRQSFRRITREMEHAHFAGEGADKDRFTRVSDWVRQTLQQSVPAAALLLFLTLTACGLGPGSRETWPTGHGAVIEVLRGYGFEVRERLVAIESFDDVDTLLLLPGAELGAADWEKLEERTRTQKTCVVAAGGMSGWPAWMHTSMVEAHNDGPLRGPAKELGKSLRLRLPITRALKPDDHDFTTLLHDDSQIYALYRSERCAVIFADEALFTNVALLEQNNTEALMEILRRLGKRTDIVSDLTGASATNPADVVSRAHMMPALLQLGLLLIVLFLARGAHFGTPTEPVAQARRALAEHARAMGLLYSKARAAVHARTVLDTYRSRPWKRRG